MPSSKKILNPLQSLPIELLTTIMTKVGSDSREDLRACMFTCKDVLASVNDSQVFRTLNLDDVVRNPLYADTFFRDVFKKCLEHSNPSAHYVQGLLEYFVHDNPLDGLYYLKQVADASVDEAIYLYEILKIANGKLDEGSEYMDRPNWRINLDRSTNSWNNILSSLEHIHYPAESVYYNSLVAIYHGSSCNDYDVGIICPKCYYYKRLIKFIFQF